MGHTILEIVIFEIQEIDKFWGQPCRFLMETENGVTIGGINQNAPNFENFGT